MKVVINDCYGGFSLSLDGERAYLARKGKRAWFYTNERREGRVDFDSYVRAEDSAEDYFVTFTFTEDRGDTPTRDQLWLERDDPAYFSCRDIPRNDPDLIAIVEELNGKASGRHARLKVVEIPDEVEFVIEEYDGLEYVAEAHRTWS